MFSALASAASSVAQSAAKALGGDGLPFETGEEITSYAGKSPWRMYKGKWENKHPQPGTQAEGKVDVSIFLYNLGGTGKAAPPPPAVDEASDEAGEDGA